MPYEWFQLLLVVLYHLPYAAWADAGAEPAADAQLIVHHILIAAVRIVFPGDGAVIAGSLAHVAVPAYSAGEATVCFCAQFKWRRLAYLVIGCLDALVRNYGPWLRTVIRFACKKGMDCFCCVSSVSYGISN
jgi:hypothetical protein